ncbi:MAG: hypothetical protein ACR2G5_10725 [Pyrinomonadaceae bacterium]
MKIKRPIKNPLSKRAKKGFRGYPVGTIAFYGPTAQRASKVAVGIVMHEGAEAEILERWYGTDRDLRFDEEVAHQISALLREHQVLSVSMVDGIIGCPHEEGVDYPEGEACPNCPYWNGRDRFTGELIH